MELWLKHSSGLTYADDTSTSVTGDNIEEVILKLEEDADLILRFMASNGLVANPKKTTLMILNHNNKSHTQVEVKVGQDTISQEKSSKLLGVIINESETWDDQINGRGGVVSALSQRLYLIRRLKNQVSKERLAKIADSLWTSKARYGLQLYGQVRLSEEDVLSGTMANLQQAQNNLLRTLENVRVKDKVSIKTMLSKHKMLSINQMNAQVKLTEMWKAVNYRNYPLKIDQLQPSENGRTSRGVSNGKLAEPVTLNTFLGNATRLWNKAPIGIKNSKSISTVKKEIKAFCLSLPI